MAAAFVLLAYGRFHFPHANPWGVAGVMAVLAVYGGLGWKGDKLLFGQPPPVAAAAVGLGICGGTVFAGEVLLEYLVLPADNTRFGYVEFGAVFLCYFLAGAWPALRKLPFRCSITAGTGAAIVSSLLWYLSVLACFYLFYGTERQAQVFRAEGNYDDFQRSGLSDFPTFIMDDFLGAGFFHLLLGPLFAAFLASAGAAVGRAANAWRRR